MAESIEEVLYLLEQGKNWDIEGMGSLVFTKDNGLWFVPVSSEKLEENDKSAAQFQAAKNVLNDIKKKGAKKKSPFSIGMIAIYLVVLLLITGSFTLDKRDIKGFFSFSTKKQHASRDDDDESEKEKDEDEETKPKTSKAVTDSAAVKVKKNADSEMLDFHTKADSVKMAALKKTKGIRSKTTGAAIKSSSKEVGKTTLSSVEKSGAKAVKTNTVTTKPLTKAAAVKPSTTKQIAAVVSPKPEPVLKSESIYSKYQVVAGEYRNVEDALAFSKSLGGNSTNTTIMVFPDNTFKVCIGRSDDKEVASTMMKRANSRLGLNTKVLTYSKPQ